MNFKLELIKKNHRENRKGYIHIDNLNFYRNSAQRITDHRENIEDIFLKTEKWKEEPKILIGLAEIDRYFTSIYEKPWRTNNFHTNDMYLQWLFYLRTGMSIYLYRFEYMTPLLPEFIPFGFFYE